MMEIDEKLENDNNLSVKNVVQKYHVAASISKEAMTLALESCIQGAKISDICRLVDDFILLQTSKVFHSVERGSAFPTCLSVNYLVNNYSPLDSDSTILKSGDMIKIDLGVHIDGYVCSQAHTLVLNENPTLPITGRKADVICASYYAAEAVTRLIKAGVGSGVVLETINKIAKKFRVNPVEGTGSYVMKRYLLEADEAVPNMNMTGPISKVDEFIFGTDEVISVNIVMSTGTGVAKESNDLKSTVFQRDVGQNYALKLRSSRAALNRITKDFSVFPFSTRALFDKDASLKLGINENFVNGLLVTRPILVEEEEEFVAQFKMTMLILPNGPLVLSSKFLPPFASSNFTLDEETQNILNETVRVGSRKVNQRMEE